MTSTIWPWYLYIQCKLALLTSTIFLVDVVWYLTSCQARLPKVHRDAKNLCPLEAQHHQFLFSFCKRLHLRRQAWSGDARQLSAAPGQRVDIATSPLKHLLRSHPNDVTSSWREVRPVSNGRISPSNDGEISKTSHIQLLHMHWKMPLRIDLSAQLVDLVENVLVVLGCRESTLEPWQFGCVLGARL